MSFVAGLGQRTSIGKVNPTLLATESRPALGAAYLLQALRAVQGAEEAEVLRV
jgi:hypothetical protein